MSLYGIIHLLIEYGLLDCTEIRVKRLTTLLYHTVLAVVCGWAYLFVVLFENVSYKTGVFCAGVFYILQVGPYSIIFLFVMFYPCYLFL